MMNFTKPPGYDQSQGGIVTVCSTASVADEGVEPDEGFVKPPIAPPFEIPAQKQIPVINLDTLSADDIRNECVEFASENRCYGKKFARDAEFIEINNGYTYHYQLETFAEKRKTAKRSEPFIGQPIDGPENGPPPGPWDMIVRIPENFQDDLWQVEIPHTAYLKECGQCVGKCLVRCKFCLGKGESSCWRCGGSRRSRGERCSSCSSSGRRRCLTCNATGQLKCRTCDGRGSLKHFRLLIVTWKNHVESFISDTSKLPKTFILEASGREIFKEENPRVSPMDHSPDITVNIASQRMIEKYSKEFPYELIRFQRHNLRAVPLTKTTYSWKRKQGEFYVYGFQKKVYFEDYPQKCCCCTCL